MRSGTVIVKLLPSPLTDDWSGTHLAAAPEPSRPTRHQWLAVDVERHIRVVAAAVQQIDHHDGHASVRLANRVDLEI